MKLLALLSQALAFSALLATIGTGLQPAAGRARSGAVSYAFFAAASIAATLLDARPQGPAPYVDAVGALLGGLLAGPLPGLAVGVTAAAYRVSASGTSALVPGSAVALHGLVGGLAPAIFPSLVARHPALLAALASAGGAVLLAGVVVAAAPGDAPAWLVSVGLPTLVVNPAAAATFVLVLVRSGPRPTPLPVPVAAPDRAHGARAGPADGEADGPDTVPARSARAAVPQDGVERALLDEIPAALAELDLSETHRRLAALGAPVLRGSRLRRVPRLAPDHLHAGPEELLSTVAAIRLRSVNRAALDLLGARSLAELAGGLRDRLDPDGPSPGATFLHELASTGRCRIEVPLRTVAGERRWMELRAQLVRGAEDDWSRVLVAVADLTEPRAIEQRRRSEEERRRALAKMEAVGTLAGGIAHDFNNILAAILGYTEVLLLDLAEREPGGESYRDALEIKAASLRAKALVQRLLSFSRPRVMERRRVDLPALVGRAAGAVRAGLAPGIDLELAVDEAAGCVEGDPAQIQQIVLDLCANAEHAMRAGGGRLTVALDWVTTSRPGAAGGEYARITVSDTGDGMDAATLERAFEPFFTTKKGEGSGLGLAVVHGIVSAHGGAIEVESALGCGATFRVLLPRLRDAAPPSVPAPLLPPRPARVLVVDDERKVADSAGRMLRSLGYEVTVLTSSRAALELFRADARAFDLVLTDEQLPELTGAELTRALLAIRPDLPVLICTGYSDVDATRAREIGARDLLAKPLERARLEEAVRQALPGAEGRRRPAREGGRGPS